MRRSNSVFEADFIVSMPKIKTHHWSGVHPQHEKHVGVVLPHVMDEPKNVLHWKGIRESILDICATVPAHFAIADGVIATEGNLPLNGTPRAFGKIVIADDPVAADANAHGEWGSSPTGSCTSARARDSWEMVLLSSLTCRRVHSLSCNPFPYGPGVPTSLLKVTRVRPRP